MTMGKKRSGKANSIPGGLAISGLMSMTLTFVLSAILAVFLNEEKITWTQSGYWIMGILFVASFFGSKIAVAAIKRQRMVISIMSGILYWGLLLCFTALFFGGRFDAIGETAGIIAAGSGTAALIRMPFRNKKKGRL